MVYGESQYFPMNIECSILFRVIGPFDQRKGIALYFHAGNTAWMDTTAGIHIVGSRGIQSWSVGMPGNEQLIVSDGIIGEPLFYPSLSGVILGGTGRVQYPEMFQGTPQIPDQETGQFPADGVEEVCLMPMGQIKTFSGADMLQNQPLMEGEIGKKRLATLGICTKIGSTDTLGVSGRFFLHIVISIEHIESVLLIEEGKQPEHIIVDFDDLTHAAHFPQFIAVTQFNIGIVMGIIIFQGSKIQILIFQEVIIGGAISPMAVADDAETAAGSPGDDRCIVKGFLKTGVVTHCLNAHFTISRFLSEFLLYYMQRN